MTTANEKDFVKCPCQHCSGPIEFEREHSGETISCPHCGMETLLFVPQPTNREVLRKVSWWKVALGALALAVLGVVAYGIYRLMQAVSEQVNLFTAFGSVLGVILIVLFWVIVLWVAIMWLVFPIFVFYGIRRLETVLHQIEQNTRPR